jgi:hypothetical protein
MNLHPYDGIERRFRDTDPDQREGLAALMQVLQLSRRPLVMESPEGGDPIVAVETVDFVKTPERLTFELLRTFVDRYRVDPLPDGCAKRAIQGLSCEQRGGSLGTR